ncbi:MAG: OsmC family protein [Thermodesulfovibrionales bacterium]
MNNLDVEHIRRVVEALKANPELGVSVTKARSVWKGGFLVETDSKGFKVVVDEPCALGGTDTAPNPMVLLLSAYGACFSIVYVFLATLRNIEIEKLEVELEGDVDLPAFLAHEAHGSGKATGFGEVRTKVFVRSRAPIDELEDICRQALDISPVGRTLARQVSMVNEFSRRRLA